MELVFYFKQTFRVDVALCFIKCFKKASEFWVSLRGNINRSDGKDKAYEWPHKLKREKLMSVGIWVWTSNSCNTQKLINEKAPQL